MNNSGFIVKPGSSIEILNKILILINNQDIYRKFQNNSHSDIYKYSSKYLAKNIFEQFEKKIFISLKITMFNKNKDNKTNPMLSDFIRVYPDSKKNRNIYKLAEMVSDR